MRRIIAVITLLSVLSFGFTANAQRKCYLVPRTHRVVCVKHNRGWWSRHRDKATVALGAGTGAIIGGVAGKGKGAVIGATAGGLGSALYTYKLRKRHRHYRRY